MDTGARATSTRVLDASRSDCSRLGYAPLGRTQCPAAMNERAAAQLRKPHRLTKTIRATCAGTSGALSIERLILSIGHPLFATRTGIELAAAPDDSQGLSVLAG